MPDITVIVPVFNEETSLAVFLETVSPILNSLNQTYEYLFVDDGSTDNTLNILKQYREKQKNIKIISFSRNFGQLNAIFCAIENAAGKCAVIIDADLQHPPEIIPEFIKKWKEGFEIVSIKGKRKDYNIIRRLISSIYYKIYNLISYDDKTKTASSEFCLLDRKVINAVKQRKEHSMYLKGIIKWVGFKSSSIECDIKQKRITGKSKWYFLKRMDLAIDAIVSSSRFPIRIWTYMGIPISTISFFYLTYIIIHTLVHGIETPGWATITVLVLFFGGIQLMSIGIIGEYVGYILREVSKKPLYIIKEKLTD